ncbi:hypothetical protein ACTA71_009045 [Dictyostelium dimigraforme]
MISDYEGPTPTKKFDQDILFDYSEGEKEFTFELLDSYISSVDEHLPELLKSFETKDIKGAVLHSHDIKGSSSYIGCEAVRFLSGKIEAYCKNDELEKAESFYPELKKEVEEVFKILDDFKTNWDKNHGDGGGGDNDDNGSQENESNTENNGGENPNNGENNKENSGSGKNTENKNKEESTEKNQNDRSKSPVPLQTTLKPVTIETPKTASDKIATETPTSLANNSNNNNNNNNSKNENGLNSKQPQTSSNSPTKIQTK